MKNRTELGSNRTGLASSPRRGPEMFEAAERFRNPTWGDGELIAETRDTYVKHALPIGTMPPPGSLKEAGVTLMERMRGHKAVVLMDKMAERLAFERSGTRLYEALIPRVKAGATWEGGPTLEDVERIHADELRHFRMLRDAVEELGGDPTLQTPSADVCGVLGLGLFQVAGDARMTLKQALQAIHVAELTDNDGWDLLVELTRSLGHDHLTARFAVALRDEEEHLAMVRSWLRAVVLGEAHLELDEADEEAAPPSEGPPIH